ncbi:MAG TPA: Hsp20/alpha crystallin family protein [Devosia sp.]
MADDPKMLSKQSENTAPIWQPLEDFRQAVDRFFDNVAKGNVPLADFQPTIHRYFSWNLPAVDMVEKDTAFELTAELPGVVAKDVDVFLKNGSIVIKGEKSEESQTKENGHYFKERQYGSFERQFTLPAGVDGSAIEATFRDGILKVTLPKTLEAQKPAKKIDVKVA